MPSLARAGGGGKGQKAEARPSSLDHYVDLTDEPLSGHKPPAEPVAGAGEYSSTIGKLEQLIRAEEQGGSKRRKEKRKHRKEKKRRRRDSSSASEAESTEEDDDEDRKRRQEKKKVSDTIEQRSFLRSCGPKKKQSYMNRRPPVTKNLGVHVDRRGRRRTRRRRERGDVRMKATVAAQRV